MTGTSRYRCDNCFIFISYKHTGNYNCKIMHALLLQLRWFCALISYNSVVWCSVLASTAASASSTNQLLVQPNSVSRTWRLIARAEWQARPPTSISNFTGPSPYVILHHSDKPGICYTENACQAAMRSMQNYHMNELGWTDIGYSFAIGADGNVYEARGFNVVGAHAPNYNSRSVGLLLIGNFVSVLPPATMLHVAKDFIEYSVEIGQLRKDYILYGHRQVRKTECPGEALYNEIKTWPNWREVE